MSDIAIRVEKLSKRYRIGLKEEKHDTLGGAISDLVRRPVENLRRLRRLSKFTENGPEPEDIIWALKDVSLEVRKGEVLGIIGPNGAGKTTLLKVLSRITGPTTGEVLVRGRVGSLLEVGTGFHPELTGRENIYLNGTILGMKKTDINSKFDEIVDFSGVEKFIDTPVKRYSSGMRVRLAFAVAAHLDPRILIIDEVLAVGDAQFQKKCLSKMNNISTQGRTVLFVSHNMSAIHGLCSRAICIDKGIIVGDGEVEKIISDYLESVAEERAKPVEIESASSQELIIEKLVLKDEKGKIESNYRFGSSMEIEIHYYARSRVSKPCFWLSVQSHYGSHFGANMLLDGIRPEYIEGKGIVKCVFGRLPLLPQTYAIRVGVRAADGANILAKAEDAALFNVIDNAEEIGLKGEVASLFVSRSAPVVVPYEWHLPNGRRVNVNLGN